MTTQIQVAAPSGAGLGGVIQGAYGNYQPAADGTYTVDTRDVPPLLVAGFSYVKQVTNNYTLPLAPLAAAVGAIVASGALSNGTVALTAGTDVMRPVDFEVGTGTTAITAGTATITYVGNDGQTTVDALPLACALARP